MTPQPYDIVYSDTVREQIRTLHPDLKPAVKANIEALGRHPFIGKHLQKELAGYLSLRAGRYRVIYRIDEESRRVEIHYVGRRRDVYELFSAQTRKAGGK